ncbi:DNA-binding HxlR family transcriptional regulator [Pedobacter sp. UYEF25]
MSQKEKICQLKLLTLRDALEVIQGKWRLPIVIPLNHENEGLDKYNETLPILPLKCFHSG